MYPVIFPSRGLILEQVRLKAIGIFKNFGAIVTICSLESIKPSIRGTTFKSSGNIVCSFFNSNQCDSNFAKQVSKAKLHLIAVTFGKGSKFTF